jgi:ribosomal protein S12 methylthiotransferase
LEFAQAKTEGRIEKLFVMGCLSERYLADLEEEIPEVDGWYGKFNYKQLLKDLDHLDRIENAPRHITTPSHYAYLKISEGCDRHCAYCAIPLITGKHQSRPMQEILDEVRYLVRQGIKEFNVIAQELTYYGIDIDGQQHIAELIEQMADIEGVEWIRLHYAYPTHFPWDLLRVMREKPNVCKYLDIALQHISDNMLSRMKRNVSKQETYELVEKLRKEVPGICLRTTLMVGFPGETDEDFAELIAFTKWARFERMGAFAYSEEEGTYSEQHYEDDVPEDVKQARLDKLMRIQQNISAEIEARKVGTTLRVIIDRQEGDWYVGRTEYCSPEVDPEVLIPASEQLTIGNFYVARITDSEEFDLYATTKF